MIRSNTIPRISNSPGPIEVTQAVHRDPLTEVLDQVLARVHEKIVAVWPLKDYVAVNPYAGLVQHPMPEARRQLRDFSNCELLMPLEYYADQYRRGEFGLADLGAAIDELQRDSYAGAQLLVADRIVEQLQQAASNAFAPKHLELPPNADRRLRTLSEFLDRHERSDWTSVICEEISKYCAAHYDEGQAMWASPWKDLPLYQAWRSAVQHDRNIEWLGLHEFRTFASQLPHSPEATIVFCLQRLGVPQRLWETMLLCQAYTVPGWSAWVKYQDEVAQRAGQNCTELVGLLAMRLAYDLALAHQYAFTVSWGSIHCDRQDEWFESRSLVSPDDSALRYALLRASEIAYRRQLLGRLGRQNGGVMSQDQPARCVSDRVTDAKCRKLAQVAFCIDVRSERIRRQLESASGEIETMGFAGFFGLPIEHVPLGCTHGSRQVPVLLSPQFQLHEGLRSADSQATGSTIQRRLAIRSWRKVWKNFASSAFSCFSCIETSGLLYGLKLLGRTSGIAGHAPESRFDGVTRPDRSRLGPTLRDLNRQGLTTSCQANLAESVLRGLGLTDNFARLVVFCGHASQTENNPLQAGLDCGACGGHSGEPNARFAALLLNQPYIQQALAERGIKIPQDVHFLAAVHNTTTDSIEFFDVEDVPQTHLGDLSELVASAQTASARTRRERLPQVSSQHVTDLLRRSRDWSEVRPEWGLAGNAAFIAAPRSLTDSVDLAGRTFLHNYDHQDDVDGTVLQQIMTAPLIVAHLINMQYYASTVDNQHFGSGTKTVHNVVGRFGILSGNGGDLMTGLPWESLHNGQNYQHPPLRLLAVIAAPREAIEKIVEKHAVLESLLTNGWLQLVAIEDQLYYRYTEVRTWDALDTRQGQPC